MGMLIGAFLPLEFLYRKGDCFSLTLELAVKFAGHSSYFDENWRDEILTILLFVANIGTLGYNAFVTFSSCF